MEITCFMVQNPVSTAFGDLTVESGPLHLELWVHILGLRIKTYLALQHIVLVTKFIR